MTSVDQSFHAEMKRRSEFYTLTRAERELITSYCEAVTAKSAKAIEATMESIRQIPHYRER
jgi:hypothetical protein